MKSDIIPVEEKIMINDTAELEKDGVVEYLKCHQAYDRYFKAVKVMTARVDEIRQWYVSQGYTVRNFV